MEFIISVRFFEGHPYEQFMKHNFYDYSRDEEGLYRFASKGKRTIVKIVGFTSTSNEHIFNLWFGDLLPDDSIDDMAISNNGDMVKVLATVMQITREFIFARSAKTKVFFTGNTNQRIILYQRILKRNYNELALEFVISAGIVHKGFYEERLLNEVGNAEYLAFLIKRKL